MSSPRLNQERIQSRAKELGFDLVGFAPAGPHPEAEYFSKWLGQGFAGEMDYLSERVDTRKNSANLLPGARSVVVCGLFYGARHGKNPANESPFIARYARGRDYHGVMQKRLRKLARFIRQEAAGDTKIFVDTAPVLDRVMARHAGLGWFGKNSCLIDRNKGSYFFIGGVITNLDLSGDGLKSDHCGTCTRCLDACPTQAFAAPYELDAKRCISYWTIEHRGAIPETVKSDLGGFLFGCDICQEVCPWNHGETVMPLAPEFAARQTSEEVLEAVLNSTPETFAADFLGRPLRRARWEGMVRNASIVIGNLRLGRYAEKLKNLKSSLRPEHAWLSGEIDWALKRLQLTSEARRQSAEEL